MISLCCLICRERFERNFDNERVEVCCLGKGTSSCEGIVIGKNGRNKANL